MSHAVLGAIVLVSGCSVSTTDNSITFKTKPEFVDNNQPAKSAAANWAGEEIQINNDGVNPLTGTGGIAIQVDANATKVSVQASFSARADVEADAKESIRDAVATLTLTESQGKVTIACGHGNAHGSSERAQSGCKRMTVTVPPGSMAQPHKLSIADGNGGIEFLGGTLYASQLGANETGQGDVKVKVTPTVGAVIVLTGDNTVSAALPATFAADLVDLKVNESNAEEAKKRIDTSAFQGLESGKGFGTAGTGAMRISLESKGLLDDYKVIITKQ